MQPLPKMKIVVKSTKTISFDENFEDDDSSDRENHEEEEEEQNQTQEETNYMNMGTVSGHENGLQNEMSTEAMRKDYYE